MTSGVGRASLCLLALLAGCGGESGAEILSISPDRVDVVSDQGFATVHLLVVLSRDTEQRVCAVSSGTDFPVVYALKPSAASWDASFEPDPGLSLGDHVGDLEVFLSSDPACQRRDGPSRQIPYRLSRIQGFAQPQGVSFRVTAETTIDDLRGSTRIDMAGGPAHAWTARSDTSWLVVDSESGVTGTDVTFHVDLAGQDGAVDGGVHTGTIGIAGDTAGMTARRFEVALQVALPVARVAMPADQPAGPTRRFRVRGVGFTADAIASGRLLVEGAPGAGARGHMLWDGARSALFVLEPPPAAALEYSNTLRRHTLRNGSWTSSALAVDMLRRMGLSPGGERLVATSDSTWMDSARIYTFDPDTLRSGMFGSLSGQVPEPSSSAPLAVTVDGRAWSGAINALMTCDLLGHGSLGMVAVGNFGWESDPSRTAMTMTSRDGGRLLVSRPGIHPFVYLDAADGFASGTFHANAAGATTFDAISDDGGRVLSGTNAYDGDFALLGTLPGSATLSGDGRRAFTLERRSDWQVGGPAPVVRVFDLTAPVEGGALPELGTVDLLDHATCAAGERTCAPTSSLVATPDGRVLFVQTRGGVVVVPIPEGLIGP